MIYGDPFSQPPGSNGLVGAVEWLQGTLLGTIAATIAVITIAAIGFGMLWGRIDLRRGATVIAGCFVLFGASNIAAGILMAASGGLPSHVEVPTVVVPSPLPPPPPPAPPEDYDPYAGASVPLR